MRIVAKTFTRTGTIYALGMGSVLPFSLLSLAVTTRYLNLADFGRLAILFAIASVLSMLSGLYVLQGTLMLVYRAADEDADVDPSLKDVDESVRAATPAKISGLAAEKRRLLGSGLVLILLTSAGWCGLAAALSPILAHVFFGSSEWTDAVLWMTVSAWSAGVWRLFHQIWRVERRPVVWALFQTLRPLLVVLLTIAALAAGYGINGVLAATAAGTAVATVISGIGSRRSFVIRPRPADARAICAAGARMVPLVLARVVQGQVSILLLSVIAGPAAAGVFFAASRIAQVPALFASGFIVGWMPLNSSPIGTAGRNLRGRDEYSAGVFSLLVLIITGLTVVVALGAGTAVRIVAPSLSRAADLIPLVAVGAAAFEIFHAYYRASRFPNRQWWYTALHLFWLAPYAATIALLVSRSPTSAVATGQLLAAAAVLGSMVLLDRRAGHPLPVRWRHLLGVVTVATACVAFAQLANVSTAGRVVMAACGIVAFPVLLRRTRLFTVGDQRKAMDVIRSVGVVRLTRAKLRRWLSRMTPEELAVVSRLLWRGESVEVVARDLALPSYVICARFARGSRQVGDRPRAPSPLDAAVGEYLLSSATAVERDMLAESLGDSGVSLVEIHELDEAVRMGRRARRRALRLTSGGEAPPPVQWSPGGWKHFASETAARRA